MKALKPNSVDAIVTDPPYGLAFMNKSWDMINQGFHNRWLIEAYRVLKPGGSLLVMGGTRTSHRLACAIEDRGFILKDTLMWLYGSGFPKAQDLGKMIDKREGAKREVVGKRTDREATPTHDFRGGNYCTAIRNIDLSDITSPATPIAKHWDGFKVGGIKPGYEPILWAVKPPDDSYIDNVLKWGVGAVNVDACRVRGIAGDGIWGTSNKTINKDRKFNASPDMQEYRSKQHDKGRFPANVIMDEEAGRMLNEQSGDRPTGGGIVRKAGSFKRPSGWKELNRTESSWKASTGTASRFFPQINYGEDDIIRFNYCAKASKSERNAGLEGMEEKECFNLGHKDNPGRNAPKKSYPRQNIHPTVKPINLFEWLIKLVTREGQIVLDPFLGSGTSLIACYKSGRKGIGIESNDEYCIISKRRIEHIKAQRILF